MKLRHEAPKHARVNHSYLWYEPVGLTKWIFNIDLGKWEYDPDLSKRVHGYSSAAPCRSAKAFRRKLKKCPRGVEFVLVSRWVGRDVYGKGSKL